MENKKPPKNLVALPIEFQRAKPKPLKKRRRKQGKVSRAIANCGAVTRKRVARKTTSVPSSESSKGRNQSNNDESSETSFDANGLQQENEADENTSDRADEDNDSTASPLPNNEGSDNGESYCQIDGTEQYANTFELNEAEKTAFDANIFVADGHSINEEEEDVSS
jgi:hypothetical protein